MAVRLFSDTLTFEYFRAYIALHLTNLAHLHALVLGDLHTRRASSMATWDR